MAQIPTLDQIEKITTNTQNAINRKVKSQEKLGKDFIPNDAGVIPEKIWKSLKDKKYE